MPEKTKHSTSTLSKARSKGAHRGKANGSKVRYAVLGLGHIAQVAVLPAFRNAAENSELKALVTGDPENAKSLSKKYRVPLTYSHENYHACLESGEVDAVYIALPNNMHRAYAVSAAQARVHLLCEKPMALNEENCQSMIDAVEENKVKLMIAYRLHFEKANLQAVENVQSGKLGAPRLFHSPSRCRCAKKISLKSGVGWRSLVGHRHLLHQRGPLLIQARSYPCSKPISRITGEKTCRVRNTCAEWDRKSNVSTST